MSQRHKRQRKKHEAKKDHKLEILGKAKANGALAKVRKLQKQQIRTKRKQVNTINKAVLRIVNNIFNADSDVSQKDFFDVTPDIRQK